MKLFRRTTLLSILAVHGCANWTPSTSLTAPDGKTVAKVEVSLAGTPAGDDTRIVLRNGSGGGLPAPVLAVEAENAIVAYTQLRWLDSNHLLVSICEATTYRVKTENLRDPAYIDAGKADGTGVPNAVWVDVENLAYSESAKRCVPRGTST
jgi:hypothetical protein